MQLRGTGGTSCPKCTGRGRRKDAMRQKYPMLGKWDRDGKAEQAQIGESTQCMHSTVREEALTAAGVVSECEGLIMDDPELLFACTSATLDWYVGQLILLTSICLQKVLLTQLASVLIAMAH
ncbi:hypothetical protein WJX77_011182 [Trebouxia sp. C0004]